MNYERAKYNGAGLRHRLTSPPERLILLRKARNESILPDPVDSINTVRND
jgi:hypothetical protein